MHAVTWATPSRFGGLDVIVVRCLLHGPDGGVRVGIASTKAAITGVQDEMVV